MINFKNIYLWFGFFLMVFVLAGCAKNVDLRRPASTQRGEQAVENKAQERESVSSMKSIVDLEEEQRHSMSAARTSNVQSGDPMKILFVGDMMFDRHIREAVEKYGNNNYGYIFETLKEKLSEYDLVVGNLEGPITRNESVSVDSKMGESRNFVFTFDPAVAGVLAENNIKIVNLGNNHILNQGEKGVEQTKKYLDVAGVEYFDDSKNLETEFPSEGGMKISFVGYNYSVPDSVEATIENIKSAKQQSDIVVVSPHWGAEYKTGDPGKTVRALARRFADAGADAVIGTHPHVVQDSEDYQGKKIFYSLGNFVFDQYFQKETMEGLGVELNVSPDGSLQYNELNFIINKKGQTELKSKN